MSAIVLIGSGRSSNTGTVGAGPSYVPFGGTQILVYATEAQSQVPVYVNGIIRNMRIAVATIGASTTHVVRLRKNGADGNSVVTINATGAFIDTTNTDTIISGDLLDYSVTRTVGAGTIALGVVSSEFYNEDGSNIVGTTNPVATTFNAGGLQVIGIGDMVGTNTNHRCFTFSSTILKNLSAYINANTLNAGITYIFPIISATTTEIPNLRLSIGAGVSGLFTDTTDVFSILDDSRWYFQFWRSGSSTGTIAPSFFMTHEISEDSKVTYHTGRSLPAITTNSTIVPIMGSIQNGATPSGSYQVRIPQDCVLYPQDIAIGVSANNNAQITVFNFQVNGVNSTVSASIPANGTGTITGSGSPVFLKAGDLVNYFINDNGATGTLQSRMVSTAFTIDKFEASSDFFT